MPKVSSLPSCWGFENTGNVGQQGTDASSQHCASADTSAGGTVPSDKKQAAVGIFLSLSGEILKVTDYFKKKKKVIWVLQHVTHNTGHQ